MSALELMPVAEAPPGSAAPSLGDVIVRALRAPAAQPCPLCGGRLARTPAGAVCRDCGTAIERHVVPFGGMAGRGR